MVNKLRFQSCAPTRPACPSRVRIGAAAWEQTGKQTPTPTHTHGTTYPHTPIQNVHKQQGKERGRNSFKRSALTTAPAIYNGHQQTDRCLKKGPSQQLTLCHVPEFDRVIVGTDRKHTAVVIPSATGRKEDPLYHGGVQASHTG